MRAEDDVSEGTKGEKGVNERKLDMWVNTVKRWDTNQIRGMHRMVIGKRNKTTEEGVV